MRRINLLRAHGSPTGYFYRAEKCRCAACRGAQADSKCRWRQTNLISTREYDSAYNAAHRDEKAAWRVAYNLEHLAERTAYGAAYYADHRAEIAAYGAAYNAAHREENAARTAAYRATHREEIAARGAAHRATHSEERASYMVAYYASHREELVAYQAAYKAAHREEYAAYTRNHEARKKGNGGTHTAADVKAQYERQKGRCYWQVTDVCKARRGKLGDTYHVDHVTPVVKSGSNGPENLVIACPTCNQSKGAKHPMDFAGILF